ncbi:MAG: tRNA (N6-isopentenyl adenosine(37)-C2)-methylthiotransferase MiaB [Ezakiella sp.]|uniref:tRNA (N6-isopentenyl adenosine(37)-C2)-methylthiotransferase MiaB n=1 Tax=Ezakiella sp. TaxID=1935205 RepID=UPI00297A4D2C|nr:tRNA (N6-isopentenyl adenosine(37)-C2)-methylthiotransferase MiaB [Ezakiella sp.]MDD7730955.1 tRNA (N6-isopentenyl adenosine(37)-C2)-methylthiotransferase MiaB [Eubacteriales bacterium]MDY6079407.1 tRNA (N6-isopentenyl adenosine(37)-C2)-methylthiotransferase MiaB [Ezakiella sp.]
MKEKYIIKTYGCQMNEHDSEILKYDLEDMGYEPTDEVDDAKIIIFNTCAIRKNAENKVYGNLGWLKGNEKYYDKIICICGCMMQSEEIRNEILAKFKNVKIIFGTNNIDNFRNLLEKHLKTGERIVEVLEKNEYTDKTFDAVRPFKYKSFVNITYGCNNFCTYCIVPYTRGRETSRTVEDIVDEVKFLVQDGVKEVMLLGQNVNSYGKTLTPRRSFTELLIELNKIRDLKRIRFMTPHPRDITDDFLELYGKLDKLMPQLHLPIQSGSDKVLKDMNRHYDTEKYMYIVDKVKKIRPDISLSTDIIVGYPTETEEDFEKTLDIVKKVRYDSAFTFIFSPRPNTPAAKLKEIDENIVKDRFNRLTDLMNSIQLENHEGTIGNRYEILVESYNEREHTLEGRNPYGRLVVFDGDREDIGKIVEVEIEKINTFTSFGRMV